MKWNCSERPIVLGFRVMLSTGIFASSTKFTIFSCFCWSSSVCVNRIRGTMLKGVLLEGVILNRDGMHYELSI